MVLVTGSHEEQALACSIADAAGLPQGSVLAGRTSTMELLAVVAVAGRVLSADTGVAHVASAFSTPSVVLFGPTPPSRWGPPVDGPHIVLWHGHEGDPLADALDPGLASITVAEVLDAVDRLDRQANHALVHRP